MSKSPSIAYLVTKKPSLFTKVPLNEHRRVTSLLAPPHGTRQPVRLLPEKPIKLVYKVQLPFLLC